MHYISPEAAGIRSENILKFIDTLEKNHIQTHSVIISKGHNILYEAYWAPFHADLPHRMYSVTKSFVSIAIGLLEEDGLISLDDPMIKYFPEELKNQTDENMRQQTIRHMLMMSTAKPCYNWFEDRGMDRVTSYFARQGGPTRPSGTIFEYDSSGSFILGALVERLTKKPLMDFLRERVLDKIGFSKEARMLKCPGGHSWGDSALLCTPMDLWKFARWTMDGGKWNGEQLLNSDYIRAATSKQIDNNFSRIMQLNAHGYGYQFWRTRDNSYVCWGMGNQYAICSPDTDMILIYNADNQGELKCENFIMNPYFDLVENTAQAEPLPENKQAHDALMARSAQLKLAVALGDKTTATAEKVGGVCYTMNENPMGITRMQFEFRENGVNWKYTNAQGDKELFFGLGHNEFGLFPETGYSKEVGGVSEPGHRYRCAASAAWTEETKLHLKVQVIDDYLANLNIIVGFRDDNKIGVFMVRAAEDFMDTYEGFATGIAQ